MKNGAMLQYEPIFAALQRKYPASLVDHLTHAVGPDLVENNELIFRETLSYAEILFDLVARTNEAISRQADASVFLRQGYRLFYNVAEDVAKAVQLRAQNIARFQASAAFYNFQQANLQSQSLNPQQTVQIESLDAEKLRAALRNEERLLLQQKNRILTILQSSHKIQAVAERLAVDFEYSVQNAQLTAESRHDKSERRFAVRRPISGAGQTPTLLQSPPRPLSALNLQAERGDLLE